MRMEVSLQARLEQKLRLAPQIIQSIEILQLPALELQDLVKEALEENPTLEEDPGPDQGEVDAAAPADGDLERELEGLERVDAVWNDYFSPSGGPARRADGDDKKWEAMQNTAAPAISLQDHLVQQLHLLDLATEIRDDRRAELVARGLDPDGIVQRIRALAEFIIYNIDDNGYLQSSLAEILEAFLAQEIGEAAPADENGDGADGEAGAPGLPAASAGPEAAGTDGDGDGAAEAPEAAPRTLPLPAPTIHRTEEAASPLVGTAPAPVAPTLPGGRNGGESSATDPGELLAETEGSEEAVDPAHLIAAEALRIVQGFEPPGVGGRSLKEVLLLQIGSDPDRYREERRIIENHLEDIQGNRFPKIAKALGTDIEEIKERIAFIRMLNPRPGSLFAAKDAHYIIPDVVVLEVDGDYEIRLEDAYIPRIHISPQYRKMLTQERDNRKVREFIKKKIEAAKWLIESIEQRQNTLLRISREIVNVQRDFLDYGLEHLKPLKMQHIADRVGVHVSTVSRALSDKYVQTPRGIYPMKFFFTGGTVNQDGTVESTVSIKQKVRDIVDKEDKRRPLSDEEIARILRKDQGLEIARRTVTKYRKQLSIPSSRQRRQY